MLLGYNPWISGARLEAPALTGFGPHRRSTRGGPVKPALSTPRTPAEGVLVLLDAQPVERDAGLLLPPDALRDRGLVQADGGRAVALGPEPPVAELSLHVRAPVEHHQRALPPPGSPSRSIRCTSAASPAACGRGRASGAPRRSLSPCTGRASRRSPQGRTLFGCRWLCAYTSARTRRGACASTSCAAGCRPSGPYAATALSTRIPCGLNNRKCPARGRLCEAVWPHPHSGWFLMRRAARPAQAKAFNKKSRR